MIVGKDLRDPRPVAGDRRTRIDVGDIRFEALFAQLTNLMRQVFDNP